MQIDYRTYRTSGSLEIGEPGSRDEWWGIHREFLAAAWKPAEKQDIHPSTNNGEGDKRGHEAPPTT